MPHLRLTKSKNHRSKSVFESKTRKKEDKVLMPGDLDPATKTNAKIAGITPTSKQKMNAIREILTDPTLSDNEITRKLTELENETLTTTPLKNPFKSQTKHHTRHSNK